ncbi:MAG: cytochrome c3 family protein [Elusimicrobiota bacterium]
MNQKKRVASPLILAFLAMIPIAVGAPFFISALRKKRMRQPVPFNHEKHVNFGIQCAACHTEATTSSHAGIPNVSVCALCHHSGPGSPKTPQALAQYIKQMKHIPWKKIYRLPAHVRFSHQIHVTAAGLDCRDCHGQIGKMRKALTRQPVPLRMGKCRSCHAREKVTTDCLACHK